MLKDILKEINESGGFSKSSIAINLNVTQGMVGDIINQLIRMGYLREVMGSPTCDTPCNSCAYARNCHSNPIKMFSLSDKGKELLKNF